MDQDQLDFYMSLVQVPHWEQVKTLFVRSLVNMVQLKLCLSKIKGFASLSTKVKAIRTSTSVFWNSFISAKLRSTWAYSFTKGLQWEKGSNSIVTTAYECNFEFSNFRVPVAMCDVIFWR
jgi:hypothetical protein